MATFRALQPCPETGSGLCYYPARNNLGCHHYALTVRPADCSRAYNRCPLTDGEDWNLARQPSGLVIEHLENISRKALEEYQTILRDHVKGKNGIYALYRRNKLYYVGLASNLRNRLKSHLRDRHASGWDRFSLYLTRTDKHLRELEALTLRMASPKGNISRTRFANAKDLRDLLRAEIQAKQKAELTSLFEYVPRTRGKRKLSKKTHKLTRVRLTDVITGRLPIRMTYKGKTYYAVIRKSGSIGFRGKTFPSPSAAARAVIKRNANGWFWWKYEKAPENWVRLGTLRN